MKRPRRQSVADTPASPEAPRFILPALSILAVALAVRLVHVWQIRRAPFFDVLMGDARGYDAWALRIAGGEWIGRDVFYQAPLYPYFLGVIYAVAGHNLLAVRVVQALLGSAACALVGSAAARLFSRGAGIAAGLALALYAPAIFFDGLLQKSVLDVFFVSLTLWLMSRIIVPSPVGARGPGQRAEGKGQRAEGNFSRTWLFLGLAMGGLALTRENAMVFVAVIAVWALVGRPTVGGVTAAAMFLAGLAIVLVPVATRNYAVGGGFYVTTSQFGSNFYIGNNPRSGGTYASLRYGRGSPEYERQDATELAEHALGRTLTPAEVSSYWTDRAMGFITSQPGAWLKLMGRKFVLLWNADEMLDTESQESYAEWSVPLRVGGWAGHFGVLVPLAVFGAFLMWPERRRLWVFYVMVAAYSASVIMFYVFARYRFPLVPFLMLFAGTGIAGARSFLFSDRQAPAAMPSRGQAEPRRGISVSTRWGWGPGASEKKLAQAAARHGRGRWSVVTISGTVIAAAIFTNWPVLSTSMMQAVTENNLATAFQDGGRLDEAIAHYRRSLELQPSYAPAYNNLGVALRANGQIDEALASYERALAVQPDYPDAHYNMANALLEKNKPEEAAAHFRTALASIPDSAGTRNNLGIALAREGKLEEAVEQFRAALAADPRSSKTHRNLGNALSSLGRREEAIGYLRQAVELDPNDLDAHYDLGTDLLEMDQLPEAESEFRAALKLAPASVTAHNNLGIALASQGRVDEALAHFREAIRLDPTFLDAKRNLEIAVGQEKSLVVGR
ncbi:MAG: hypothetical protein A3H97_17245 [Acidobacteria bacterium RIFCSPLOWO2_02_FULL_65_29]|nr:MAG: hypothetical protein A3H97_17245 [Acidobacteria bacterium RIFCSPLOWO2_02_FULL_65_29]